MSPDEQPCWDQVIALENENRELKKRIDWARELLTEAIDACDSEIELGSMTSRAEAEKYKKQFGRILLVLL